MSPTSQTTSNTTNAGTTSGTGANTGTTSNLTAPQTADLSSIWSQAPGALSTAQAPLTSELNAFQGVLNGATNTSIPASSAAAGGLLSTSGAAAASQGLSNLAGFTNAGSTQQNIDAANQYVAGANIPAQVQADMVGANQEATQVTNPGIDASAAGSGNINSSRDAIEHGMVAGDLAQQAGTLGAGLQAQDYTTGLGLSQAQTIADNANMLQAGTALAQSGGYVANSGTGANTGSVAQSTGQAGNVTTAVAGQTSAPYSALQNYYNLVGQTGLGSTSSGTTASTGANNSTSNVVGTSTPSTLQQMQSFTGMLGSLLSDARAKTGTHAVGKLDNGLTVYRYRYIGDPAWHIGLLAQDVEQELPDAVSTVDGFKRVNYLLATL